MKERTSDNSNS